MKKSLSSLTGVRKLGESISSTYINTLAAHKVNKCCLRSADVRAMYLGFNLFIKEMRSNWGNGTMSLVGKKEGIKSLSTLQCSDAEFLHCSANRKTWFFL